jgi:hypothetical protein
MRKTQLYVRTSRRGLDSKVTVKSKEAMGMMYSKDWVALSNTYARVLLKRKTLVDQQVAE